MCDSGREACLSENCGEVASPAIFARIRATHSDGWRGFLFLRAFPAMACCHGVVRFIVTTSVALGSVSLEPRVGGRCWRRPTVKGMSLLECGGRRRDRGGGGDNGTLGGRRFSAGPTFPSVFPSTAGVPTSVNGAAADTRMRIRCGGPQGRSEGRAQCEGTARGPTEGCGHCLGEVIAGCRGD